MKDIEDIKIDIGSEEEYEKLKDEVDEKLWEKVERTGKKLSFKNDLLALYNYFVDNKISWYRKAIVVGALIYFITPVDVIPDLTPLLGYLDDLGVITAVVKYMGSEILPYYKS